MTAGPAAPSPRGPRRAWPVIHTVLRALVGAVLVVFVVLIAVRLAGQPSTVASTTGTPVADAPTATPTPTSTPTPTPSATPTPTAPAGSGGTGGGTGGTGGGTGGSGGGTAAPVITSFSAPSTVDCPPPGEAPAPGVPVGEPPTVSFSWTSTGADEAWFGIGTTDAQAEPFSSVGTNDSIAVSYQCGNASEVYTVTVSGAGGATSKTVEVENVGYVG